MQKLGDRECCFRFVVCSMQGHQPRGGGTHNELGPPTLITKEMPGRSGYCLILQRKLLNEGFQLLDAIACVKLTNKRKQNKNPQTKNQAACLVSYNKCQPLPFLLYVHVLHTESPLPVKFYKIFTIIPSPISYCFYANCIFEFPREKELIGFSL